MRQQQIETVGPERMRREVLGQIVYKTAVRRTGLNPVEWERLTGYAQETYKLIGESVAKWLLGMGA